MNGQTITMMPTMCIPEKLNKKELVEQYKYMEGQAFKQGQALHDVCCKLHDINKMALHLESLLGALVDSYDANDQEAIAVQLKAVSERRKPYKKQEVH